MKKGRDEQHRNDLKTQRSGEIWSKNIQIISQKVF